MNGVMATGTERGQRQANAVGNQAHFQQGPLDGDRIGFDKQRLVQRHQGLVKTTRRCLVAAQGGGTHFMHLQRSDVGSDGDVALAAQQDQLDCGGIVVQSLRGRAAGHRWLP